MANLPVAEFADVDIRAIVLRLARPRVEGGHVIDRAAILDAGSDSALIERWTLDHSGRPEPSRRPVGAVWRTA